MDDKSQSLIIRDFISDVLSAMGVEADIEIEDSITKGLIFNIQTRDSYVLIGRQGSHLHSLQIIIQALAAKRFEGAPFPPFMIDVDDYKRKREWFLKETAKQAVLQLKRIGKPVSLEPMPNFERRLVHSYLQENFPEVTSSSVGFEPRRQIVVRMHRQ